MSSLPAFPLPVPPPPTSVLDDLPCRSCGYNLRTLATDAVCPECATPVAVSLRTELLRDGDPNWLWQMSVGCRLTYWGIWGSWFSYIFTRSVGHRMVLFFTIPSAAAAALGTWMLTTADPSGIGEDKYGNLRLWARGLGIVQFAATLIQGLAAFADPGMNYLVQGFQMIGLTVWGGAMLWYLDRLRKRAQSKMSSGFRFEIFLFLGLSVFYIAMWSTRILGSRVNFPFPFFLLTRFPFSWLNVLIVYSAISQFNKVLKDEVSASRSRLPSTWRTAGASLYSLKQLFRSKSDNANEK